MGASKRSGSRKVVLSSDVVPVASGSSFDSTTRAGRYFGARVLPFQSPLSAWTRSRVKRVTDLVCVLSAMPVALPLMALTALAVRLTSRGPVLFRQHRVGRGGRTFPILKFRTMPVQPADAGRTGITTSNNQRFTPIGPFLRRWKLDELPQLINVLRGEMSLVGPRPKLPSYEASRLLCRPGLTGFATMVFAREERAMAQVPSAQVDAYYQAVVKPFKQKLDEDYMAEATPLSDLALIFRSVFRLWGDVALTDLPPWMPNLAPVQLAPEAIPQSAAEWTTARRSAALGPEQVLAHSSR